LHVDVRELYYETQQAIEKWIRSLESNAASAKAKNVARNLPKLVRVSTETVPITTSTGTLFAVVNKTN
jgi:hypothetical protein